MSTIVAIATPKGNGGIGIVRLSGPRAKELLARTFLPQLHSFENFIPWRLHHGKILDSHDEPLDDVLVVFMPSPATYTGEDIVEVHCHGGYMIAMIILENFIRLGARQAEPGEFTKRAFLNGRMDLSQAEAVAELIASPSREAIRYSLNRMDGFLSRKVEELRKKLDNLRAIATVALDFPDDEIDAFDVSNFLTDIQTVREAIKLLLAGTKRSRTMQHGALVALAGAVNAGKSSMLNILCGKNRALVCDMPGTTRDFLEEWINIDGLPIRLCDTAGLRPESSDTIENMGMKKSREMLQNADAVILLLDGAVMGRDDTAINQPDESTLEILEIAKDKPLLVVWNKSDVHLPPHKPYWIKNKDFCVTSCATGHNLDILCKKIYDMILGENAADMTDNGGLAPNERQAILLAESEACLADLQKELHAGQSLDLCLAHLDDACDSLGQIIGLNSTSELLDHIFSNFCIGK